MEKKHEGGASVGVDKESSNLHGNKVVGVTIPYLVLAMLMVITMAIFLAVLLAQKYNLLWSYDKHSSKGPKPDFSKFRGPNMAYEKGDPVLGSLGVYEWMVTPYTGADKKTNVCKLYDFGLGKISTSTKVLDGMQGLVKVPPWKSCLGPNELYVKKVEYVCTELIKATDGNYINLCQDRTGSSSELHKVGDHMDIYDSKVCSDTALRTCKGSLGILFSAVTNRRIGSPPAKITDPNFMANVVEPNVNDPDQILWYMDIIDQGGNSTASGLYARIMHSRTEKVLQLEQDVSKNGGYVWRIVVNNPFFTPPIPKHCFVLVYLGHHLDDWKRYPLSAQDFCSYALENGLSMLYNDPQSKKAILTPASKGIGVNGYYRLHTVGN